MSTTVAFFTKAENVGVFEREYGFYWQRSQKDDAGRITKAETWTTDERAKAAKAGEAMKDGSFPIKKPMDVQHAVEDWGRAGAKPSVKEHIKDRAKAIDCSHMLPDDWQDKPMNNDSNTDSTAA